jgi:diaminohydroxyphosphoribosylaminopyrimidine deaminase / 5-amino-6-(5-phosphoribosylamino)uracil reductase
MTSDEGFMNAALDLAEKGAGFVSPNPMVGAVVVKDGRIVGSGYHRAVGTAHAEVNALDDAGEEAVGATLYVTLEPCNHTGRTPPCTEKILKTGVKKVVVAMLDPNPNVKGGGNDRLRAEGVAVVTGVCEARARKLNESFIKYICTRRPFVILKSAATLDGRIATRTGDARWVTGPASRAFVHEIRHAVDGILVGIGTVRADDPRLTTRLEGRTGRDPIRIILDSRLSISETAKVLRLESDSDTIIITGPSAPIDKKERLQQLKGVRVMEAPLKDGKIDLRRLMERLGALGITSLLVEGGGRVMASALSEGIGDKIVLFYAPKLLGGDDGIPICSGPGPEKMADCVTVQDIEVRRFGDDILIEGYFRR